MKIFTVITQIKARKLFDKIKALKYYIAILKHNLIHVKNSNKLENSKYTCMLTNKPYKLFSLLANQN